MGEILDQNDTKSAHNHWNQDKFSDTSSDDERKEESERDEIPSLSEDEEPESPQPIHLSKLGRKKRLEVLDSSDEDSNHDINSKKTETEMPASTSRSPKELQATSR